MKRVSMILVAAALLILSAAVSAEGKIAVFNLQNAILNTDAAQQRIQEFESRASYSDLRADFEQLRSDLQELNEEAQRNSATWSDARKQEHQQQMEYKRGDLEHVAKKLQNENQSIVQQLLQERAEEARSIIQDIIEEEDIGLVLNAEAVTYADSSYDITAKITDRLNNAD